MDLPTLEALSRVLILASSYVEDHPQPGAANVQAISQVLCWLQHQEDLPADWNSSQTVASALDIRH